jgi:hypothetical protein
MLDKAGLESAIETAFRSVEPGEDSVSQLASALASAFDAFVKSGTVEVVSSGGGCTYAGTHPPLNSTGSVK